MSIARPCPYDEDKAECKYEKRWFHPRLDKCPTCSRSKKEPTELEVKVSDNEWHFLKDGELPNTEFGRADVTVAYINAYENTCSKDCCFDGTNFVYWDDRKPIGWKKVDIFGKIYAWKYPEKLPEPPKDCE